jgi:transposase-like protein
LATGLHGAARTTPRVRAELQASQESTRALAARYGLNAKTVAKWRQRTSTADRPMGPSKPKSTVLTEIEEAIVVEFRRRTLLPLDDVLGCLRETIPYKLHTVLTDNGTPRRIEPDIFRHTVEGASVTVDLQFKVESEAIAFAQAFSGELS